MSTISVTNNISELIQASIRVAITNNDSATLRELVEFSEEILYKSIKNGSSGYYQEYIEVPLLLNLMIANRLKEKEIVSHELNKYSFKIPGRILRENLGFHLADLGKDLVKEVNAKDARPFYYEAYRNFSNLLFQAIQKKDFDDFQYVVTYFSRAFERVRYHDRLQESKPAASESISPEKEYGSTESIVNSDISLNSEVNNMQRHVLTGVRYWLNYLYYQEQIDKELFVRLTELVRIPITSGSDIVNDLLFVTDPTNEKYLDWIKWEYDDATFNQHQSHDSTSTWMRIGFFVDILRSGGFYMNPDKLDEMQITNALATYAHLKEDKETIIEKHERWALLLGTTSRDGLINLCDRVLSSFRLLEKSQYKTEAQEIATLTLSEAKIQDFKDSASALWRKQARIRYLFEKMDSQTIIPEGGKNLIRVGQRTFLERGRIAFIDGEKYSRIYGIDEMGGIIGRWEDDLFFDILTNATYQLIAETDAEKALDRALLSLKDTGVVPNVILTSPEFSYKDEHLLNSPKFKAKNNLITENQEMSFFYIGSYDEIPVYTSFNGFLQKRFIVCDFERSFNMEIKTNPEWFDDILNLAVRDLSSDEINDRIRQFKDKAPEDNRNEQLSNEEIMAIVKTSVVIDAWTIADFVIKDVSSFIVAEIE